MDKILPVVLLLAVLAGCGGNASPAPATRTPPSSTPPTSTGSPPAPLTTPIPVAVTAGAAAAGVNITVGSPATVPASSAPNAQDLGVAALTGTASAFNTGTTIAQGDGITAERVVLFGPGLSGTMQVTIRGPSDIQVSNIVSITAKDGTPGVSFSVVVAPNAALGARTVVLQNANGDVTTFTGGLEVVP